VPPAAPPAPAESEPAPETVKPEEPKAPEYTYNPQGRRDPFRSILVTSENVKKFERLLPLQRVEIAEMKLIGIVWGSLGSAAMVETPDGKGYTIRKGTLLGPRNGVVKKITERNVTVLEEYTDIFGDSKMREVVMELYPQKEGTE
jgi:type IV pilus assembly protein PilP